MTPAPPNRVHLLQVLFGNAVLLSAIYLVVGIAFEVLLKIYPAEWVETGTVVLDSLPARLLHLLGVLGPLSEAAAYNRVSGFWVRAIFAGTTIAIIFLLAAAVAAVMTLITRQLGRRRRSP